jgi:mercuric ion transport protein
MTLHDDRPRVTTRPSPGGARHTSAKAHAAAKPDGKPPTRAKVTASLAALACAACCALPFLIAGGVLTGAGAAIAEQGLIAASALLLAAAATMWWLHRRRQARKAAEAGQGGCASGNCAC